MDNLRFYNKVREVPTEAQKPITAGRLKNKTDINPMWRIQALTELFGPCGVGWWYEITEKNIVPDDVTGQKAAFVDILLYYKDPASGEVSKGIPGTGGASFVAKENNGPYLSDECFKMALTDAISVACKAIGVGADIYWAAGRSKYAALDDPELHHPLVCDECGGPIKGVKQGDRVISAQELADSTGLCVRCWRALKGGANPS